MSERRILIVRLAGVGDVVMASAAARRLRALYPRAHIAWLAGATAAPLVQQFAEVDEVMSIDATALLRGGTVARVGVLLPLWRKLLKARFTDVVLLHVDRRYRVLLAPLRGVRVVTPVRSESTVHPAQLVAARYLGDEYARIAEGIGHVGPIVGHYPLAELRSALPSVPRPKPRVALVPGGTRNVLRESTVKRWPVEHYATLAGALAAEADVVLVGDMHDQWVRPHFVGTAVTDHLGSSTVDGLLREFAACDLVIAHDTGPLHVARLVRAHVVALFGPTMPSQFVVEDERTTVLWGGAELACRPCYDGHEFAACADNVCMSGIAPEIVLATARSILRRHATPSRSNSSTAAATASGAMPSIQSGR